MPVSDRVTEYRWESAAFRCDMDGLIGEDRDREMFAAGRWDSDLDERLDYTILLAFGALCGFGIGVLVGGWIP